MRDRITEHICNGPMESSHRRAPACVSLGIKRMASLCTCTKYAHKCHWSTFGMFASVLAHACGHVLRNKRRTTCFFFKHSSGKVVEGVSVVDSRMCFTWRDEISISLSSKSLLFAANQAHQQLASCWLCLHLVLATSNTPQLELKNHARCFGLIMRGVCEPSQTFDLIWNRKTTRGLF